MPKSKFEYLLTIIILLLWSSPSNAQKEKEQFDFWIGEWHIQQKILDSNGEWLDFRANTKVAYILEKNAIEENWEGEVQFFWAGMDKPEIIKGYSIRYYDENEDRWIIYWMDTMNPAFTAPYNGTFLKDGYGEFFRTNEIPNGTSYSRIIFDQKDNDHVTWKLAISSDQQNWNTIWVMNMVRK